MAMAQDSMRIQDLHIPIPSVDPMILYITMLLQGVQGASLDGASGSKSVADESRPVAVGFPPTPVARKAILKDMFKNSASGTQT